MMNHFSTLLAAALILLNLTGLTILACRWWLRDYLLSKVVAPVVVCLGCFFLEHFHGLGTVAWLWPLTSFVSALLIWRNLDLLRKNWIIEAVQAAGFGYAFAWRFCLPNVDASSEKLADLAMISSYRPGTTLPPVDAWLPPYRFDVYYSFQHYASSLLGRIFSLEPGITYNLGFCVMISLTVTAAAGAAFLISKRRWAAALATFAFLLGGTGASIPVHLMMDHPSLHSSMRFIGGTATPERATTPVGQWLIKVSQVPAKDALELPLETFSYLASLGDYHPPLSGFLLLAIALLCVALIENEVETRWTQAVLAGSVPLTLVANSWSLPLQGLLLAAWVAYRLWRRQSPDWRLLTIGLAVTTGLVFPCLSRFALRAQDYSLMIRPVPASEHTPLLLGSIVLYPIVVLVLAQLAFGERRPAALWLCGFWIALLLFSEFLYVDDVYSGKFNRFNSTLKWWPWIYAGVLLSLGALNLVSKRKLCRYTTLAVLCVVSLYAGDLALHLIRVPKRDIGRLDGTAWVTSDGIERAILEFLKSRPPGVVLQRLDTGAFTYAPAITLFAGQTAFMGWPEHEKLWRGWRADIELRNREVQQFYRGDLSDPAGWLKVNQIDHVLWLKNDAKMPAGTFDRLNAQIGQDYYWREFYVAGDFHVGVWSRRPR